VIKRFQSPSAWANDEADMMSTEDKVRASTKGRRVVMKMSLHVVSQRQVVDTLLQPSQAQDIRI